MEVSLKKCLKNPKFQKPIPAGFLFDSDKMDSLKQEYLTMVQKELLQSGGFERGVESLKKQFITKRIGPLELLQPNEEVEEMPEDDLGEDTQ